ncbi:MAG: hypothetical protein PGN25_14705 [Methylorubrum populi]
MDEVITCTLLGYASTTVFDVQADPSGRQIWTGVRVRTVDGKARFFPSMLVEAEASLILDAAMQRGEQVELWLSGKVERAYPYDIRTATEAWYTDACSSHLRGQAIKTLVIGILTLPLFGLGLLVLWMSMGYFWASGRFAPCHSRETFELGYEVGGLGQKPTSVSNEQLQAA